MSKFCVAPGCLNSLSSNRELTYHLFPKDPNRRKLWLSSMKLPDFFSTDPPTSVCSIHFTRDSYRSNATNTLKKTAVPSIVGDEATTVTTEDDEEPKPQRRVLKRGKTGNFSKTNKSTEKSTPPNKKVKIEIEHDYETTLRSNTREPGNFLEWAVKRQKRELDLFPELQHKTEADIVFDKFMNVQKSLKKSEKSRRMVPTTDIRQKMQSLEIKLGVSNAIWGTAIREMQRLKSMLHDEEDVIDFSRTSNFFPPLPVKSVMELRLLDHALELHPEGKVLLRAMFQETHITNTQLFGFLLTNMEKLMAPECTKTCSWSGLSRNVEQSNVFELRRSITIDILCDVTKQMFPKIPAEEIHIKVRKHYHAYQYRVKRTKHSDQATTKIKRYLLKMEENRGKKDEDDNLLIENCNFDDLDNQAEDGINDDEDDEEADWVKNL